MALPSTTSMGSVPDRSTDSTRPITSVETWTLLPSASYASMVIE
jgi:hypothetical protein